jgi:uncharacterized protein (TIGR00255 family)
MTGFARARRSAGAVDVEINLKSVNHRGLDLHFHMPSALDPFEAIARAALKQCLERGHVQVNVLVDRGAERGANGTAGSVNIGLLERWADAFREVARVLGSSEQPGPEAALRVPGILETDGRIEWTPELESVLNECLAEALNELQAFRAREGAVLAAEIAGRARAVEDLAERMSGLRENAAAAFQQRLTARLNELLRGAAVEPQRLIQEAAILADRSDISEELIRLKTHAAQVLEVLHGEGGIGKKLDFLLQEMNRESNTILSKTGGLGDQGLKLTDLGLAAKAEIDKMREQSLNLE